MYSHVPQPVLHIVQHLIYLRLSTTHLLTQWNWISWEKYTSRRLWRRLFWHTTTVWHTNWWT